MRHGSGFTLIELLLVIVVIAMVAAYLVPAAPRVLCHGREAAAQNLVDSLIVAASTYESDYGTYPDGDGSGSAELVRALRSPNPRGLAYFEFQPGQLDRSGHIRNPVRPSEDLVHYWFDWQAHPSYKPNPALLCSGWYYRRLGPPYIKIWCRDCEGVEAGICNTH